jgi:suppressor of G2 allele of SKP1
MTSWLVPLFVHPQMESGGTVLSTNWEEIKKERVSVRPPDGMEFKKWDQ